MNRTNTKLRAATLALAAGAASAPDWTLDPAHSAARSLDHEEPPQVKQ